MVFIKSLDDIKRDWINSCSSYIRRFWSWIPNVSSRLASACNQILWNNGKNQFFKNSTWGKKHKGWVKKWLPKHDFTKLFLFSHAHSSRRNVYFWILISSFLHICIITILEFFSSHWNNSTGYCSCPDSY